MPTPVSDISPDSAEFQAQFHQRWNHLNDPHVRALAWLLDAPDLLDAQAPQWQGKIATYADRNLAAWLASLESEPEQLQQLHNYIGSLPSARLGLYAEKLMAFYFQQRQLLVAHSVQVRASKNDTIGEFDFLLRLNGELVHWEFATKFYLLETSDDSRQAEDFLGPNLADSLGAKMQKILHRQLALSQHPAAQPHLEQGIASAQALVKGWLFYQNDHLALPAVLGVSANACRGYWCGLSTVPLDDAATYVLLTRQRWLAPAKIPLEQSFSAMQVRQILLQHFSADESPVMLATLRPQDGYGLETCRGFVVPDDWGQRAAEQRRVAAAKSS
ncbi:DUF1853 family protein [Paraherbaspirillum soli]|uniref:DUF1853 family protein n=1 Tax=Paraherbaspirillum soli TaxID=631222 RepID=A0ABW0M8N5_9BURK